MVGVGLFMEDRRDFAEADRWYRKAADAGHDFGMYRLAELLDRREQRGEAMYWYRKAAEAGSADAMGELSIRLLEQGERAEADRWRQKAGEAGKDVRPRSGMARKLFNWAKDNW
jgi:TPR repeat protein